ncbi:MULTISPECIES: hypothetical protein [Rhodococcus]|uniref:hypothetical protein n=1 Tax=Rhodococcus TaxID=1827 RepID=UPI00146C50B0|nr:MULTISPECIES: hypothetical protein [Rhodococcus]MBX4171869.1 hypothetical protein [Rhodococcus sp. DMU2021]MDJ0401377.1 hypothetical protein [Rhodococcus rhodochrous]NLU65055.1 hypothetical protein [Rhodococcus sp. HNM0563]QXF84087.1 hypothetical protein HBA53_23510 [Rhodococcus pyridinivorans]
MPRSVIEDRLRTAVLKAMPLPDIALDAVVAGIPLLTGENTTRGRRSIDLVWRPESPNPWDEDGRGWV